MLRSHQEERRAHRHRWSAGVLPAPGGGGSRTAPAPSCAPGRRWARSGPAWAPWRGSSRGCCRAHACCRRQVLARAVLPQAVQAEQAHLRGAVAGALAAAAARKFRVVGLERRQAARPQFLHPGWAAADQRPVHRRLDEAEVVVVAGIVDRPAGPRVRATAPLRARGFHTFQTACSANADQRCCCCGSRVARQACSVMARSAMRGPTSR